MHMWTVFVSQLQIGGLKLNQEQHTVNTPVQHYLVYYHHKVNPLATGVHLGWSVTMETAC